MPYDWYDPTVLLTLLATEHAGWVDNEVPEHYEVVIHRPEGPLLIRQVEHGEVAVFSCGRRLAEIPRENLGMVELKKDGKRAMCFASFEALKSQT